MQNAVKKADVKVGDVYAMKVSGKLTRVRIDEVLPLGRVLTGRTHRSKHSGWLGTNLNTNKQVRIKSAAKLRLHIPQAASTLEGDLRQIADDGRHGRTTPEQQDERHAKTLARAQLERIEASYVESITPEKQAEARKLIAELAEDGIPLDAPCGVCGRAAADHVLADYGADGCCIHEHDSPDVPRTLLENVREALRAAEQEALANAPADIVAKLEREQRDFTGTQRNANVLDALDVFVEKAYSQGCTPAMRKHGHFLVNQLRGQ